MASQLLQEQHNKPNPVFLLLFPLWISEHEFTSLSTVEPLILFFPASLGMPLLSDLENLFLPKTSLRSCLYVLWAEKLFRVVGTDTVTPLLLRTRSKKIIRYNGISYLLRLSVDKQNTMSLKKHLYKNIF